MRAHAPEAKKMARLRGSGWIWRLVKKEHPPLKGRSASAARAGRWRNGPTVIAVHRRCATKTTAGPVSTTRLQNPGPAPHIYKYTTQNHYNPFRRKVQGGELLLFTKFFPKPKRIYGNLDYIKSIRIFR